MVHETFHEALVEELVKRHGLCEEVLDLLAFRAVDGAGRAGGNNMKLAMRRHGLRALLAAPSGLQRFAERVDRISQRRVNRGRPASPTREAIASFTSPTRASPLRGRS